MRSEAGTQRARDPLTSHVDERTAASAAAELIQRHARRERDQRTHSDIAQIVRVSGDRNTCGRCTIHIEPVLITPFGIWSRRSPPWHGTDLVDVLIHEHAPVEVVTVVAARFRNRTATH